MPAEWDLLVVGAGSAGCVIAARVSRTGARVLLLEAGTDYPDPAQLPADLRDGNRNSTVAHDWGFRHLPSSARPPIAFPRGKVVGGSSAVNTCIALRGERSDYDEWGRLAGEEWSWERCLPAFVRLEADRDFGGDAYHGSAGPLPIGRYPLDQLTPIQSAFQHACRAAGVTESPDHNAPGSTGFGRTPLNKVGDERVSVAAAYLTPDVRARPNLEIRPASLVRRVVFDGTAARGVELASGETIECPHVVLCAGAILTPPLLVRSGIGPHDTLDRLGVDPVVVREGVGTRLLDHPGTILLLKADSRLADPRSPLMQTCMRTTVVERNDLFIEPLSFVARGDASMLTGIAVAAYRSYGAGRLEVESLEPDACPRIASCFFEDDAGTRDRDLMAAGLRTAIGLACMDPMKEVIDEIVGLGPDAPDEDLLAHVLRFNGSGYHPCGTAPMGHADDPAAVCDQYGRVIGATGLRIADASIMPTVPRCNINIPTIMIGERFGEWLADEVTS